MYLKKLTLRGFKSFASATTLQFEPGITCVVGPNGSGKSNVVDALSWVMGEQGAKSLRGGKMEDVIFAGTSTRAPLGRAEVELTIDNSDGALPIEYTEVTITRTMFRSGGSEYAINGAPARLLDVQELLSDSGIGREMHVIVGQGQLDAILQATPESRRGFIEEAAGVLKHRKRKEKALRKLEGTRANVERLTDLLGELQRQLRPLGRQAETARKAAVIQAELRDAKARLLADDLHAAQQALAEDLADERASQAARERAERAVRQAETAEAAAEVRLQEASRAYDVAQEHWYALAAVAERVSTTLSISAERTRMADAQPALDVGGRDPDALEKQAAEVREQEAELGRQLDAAHGALTDATLERNSAEQAHAAAEQAYAGALRAVADRREGLARLTGQVNSISSRLDAGGEEIARLERRRGEAHDRAQEADRAYLALESELAGLGADETDLDARHERASAVLREIEARQEELKSAEAAVSRSRAGLEARVEALRLTAQRRDGSEALLDGGVPGLSGRLAEQVTVTTGWEVAVGAALLGATEAVVADDVDTAVAALDRLWDSDGGRAWLVLADRERTTEPAPDSLVHEIDAPDRLRPALEALLGHVVGVETRAEAAALVADRVGVVAVTRDGDRFSAAAVEGGSRDAPSLLELATQLQQAEQDLADVVREGERLRFAVAESATAMEEARLSAESALEALHASDAQLTGIADTLARHRQTQASALKEAERLAEAIEAAHASRTSDEGKLAELQARLEAASGEEVVEPDPSERDRRAAEARRARAAEMEARLALRTLEEKAKALAGRAESLLRAAEAERQSRAQARARAEQLRREAEVAAACHGVAAKLAERVDLARRDASRDKDVADTNRREAESAVTSARHATRAAAAALDEVVRGAHQDEMARIELRMRIEQLTDRALTELGMEAESLVAEFGPHLGMPAETPGEDDGEVTTVPYDREVTAQRLRRAERALGVLGRVNPLALEEYDAMKARHAFLAEQLDDLKKTRADLVGLIEEVDRRVQEVFEAAYRDVERAFEEVFTRLFPGGEGRLVLTDPGDWLTTGVDVEARPAGKQVKRLSLLSGGERSLVAVAFLVSLFIARPSPFYILDEVEAALDDANLSRLLSIYEQLRADSQLIVITHQKRTMEIADSLYGVTMRGDGISTVVSQRLGEG